MALSFCHSWHPIAPMHGTSSNRIREPGRSRSIEGTNVMECNLSVARRCRATCCVVMMSSCAGIVSLYDFAPQLMADEGREKVHQSVQVDFGSPSRRVVSMAGLL